MGISYRSVSPVSSYDFNRCLFINGTPELPSLNSVFKDNVTFNETITIGEKVGYVCELFSGCLNFNQPVTVPSGVINCSRMFENCTNFSSNVYFVNDSKIVDVNAFYRMFAGCNNSLQKNIYCQQSLIPFITNEHCCLTDVSNLLYTYDNTNNICYNTEYNIYCYWR